ncbi:hypothetical protein GGH17_006624, partial [Coemansia sp. RSA 788]
DYEGVDENQTDDLIYDISKSEIINESDSDSSDGAFLSVNALQAAVAVAFVALCAA